MYEEGREEVSIELNHEVTRAVCDPVLQVSGQDLKRLAIVCQIARISLSRVSEDYHCYNTSKPELVTFIGSVNSTLAWKE